MKLRLAFLLSCCFCLATHAVGQLAPIAPTAPPPTKGACPETPGRKTAWFDPSQYLMHGNGVKILRPVSAPDPEYSEYARQKKISGTILLALAINAGGTVDTVKVVCSLEPSLDQKAVEAVEKWKFAPATKDGEPVPVQIEVSVGYRLY